MRCQNVSRPKEKKLVALVFEILSFALLAFIATSSFAQDPRQLAQDKACLACHDMDRKIVGPAFREIRKRYGNLDSSTLNSLVEKILKGGGGVWGAIPMPPNKTVSKDEARVLVKWIFDTSTSSFHGVPPPRNEGGFTPPNNQDELSKIRAEMDASKRKQDELEAQLTQARQQQAAPVQAVTPPTNERLSLDASKVKCGELGFKPSTEGFGKCVLQLSK